MTNENTHARCHLRVYDEDGVILTTNPNMPAEDMAKIIIDIMFNPDDHRNFHVKKAEPTHMD